MKNQNSSTSQLQHIWAHESLLAKAQRFAEEMLRHPKDDWRFALWSTLVLELLGRAALSKINPALLAEPKEWNNIYFSLGFTPKTPKFIPKSIDISSVFKRLADINIKFTRDLSGFAIQHMTKRNEEIHSGGSLFDSQKSSKWLPIYYETCSILMESLDENLDLLIGEREAAYASTIITAYKDESAKIVLKSIETHKKSWEMGSDADREKLSSQSTLWATRRGGHIVTCPACGSDALVTGTPIAEPLQKTEDNLMTETQQYNPSQFECIACKLKIASFSQLLACGLGDTYKATFTYNLEDYYSPSDEYSGYEDDNNEP